MPVERQPPCRTLLPGSEPHAAGGPKDSQIVPAYPESEHAAGPVLLPGFSALQARLPHAFLFALSHEEPALSWTPGGQWSGQQPYPGGTAPAVVRRASCPLPPFPAGTLPSARACWRVTKQTWPPVVTGMQHTSTRWCWVLGRWTKPEVWREWPRRAVWGQVVRGQPL